ncbi:MAG: hypothetical protein E5X14_18075, partial [Mesorhizobium sp.]
HPDIVLDIHLDDRFVDLVEEGFDVAVRISRLENSSLIARRLGPFSIKLCASPDLLAKHGTPTRPQDLSNMPCIVDTNGRSLANWRFKGDGEDSVSVTVSGPIEVNSPMAARAAAVSGLGFTILPDFIAAPEVASGSTTASSRAAASSRSIRIAAICPPRSVSSSISWCTGSGRATLREARPPKVGTVFGTRTCAESDLKAHRANLEKARRSPRARPNFAPFLLTLGAHSQSRWNRGPECT